MKTTFFGENLKKLRESDGLKQSEMLATVGFPQSTWNNYERNKSMPNLADLIKISQYFGVLESDLLHADLADYQNFGFYYSRFKAAHPADTPSSKSFKEYKFDDNQQIPGSQKRVIPAPKPAAIPPPNQFLGTFSVSDNNNIVSEPTITYRARMPKIVTMNEHGVDNIVYVPIKARAGYLLGHGDQQFIETLPTFRMPGLNNRTYRMFEVEGLSMAGTLSDRDRVIGEWVSSIDQIRENRVHVIVTGDGVLIKRVLNRVKERGVLYLKSDTITHRQDYPLMELDPKDIQEIWYVNMKVSSDLSEPAEIYQRVSDLEIFKHEVMKKLGMRDGN